MQPFCFFASPYMLFPLLYETLSLETIDKDFFNCYISGIISCRVVFVANLQPCLWRVHIALWQKKVMNGFYELHFHGNRQEIEKEKQRKRELMSYFPKTLRTVDETIYVLHDDEKQKQTDCFESKPVSPLTVAPAKDEPLFNIRGIGEQQSEKPKKDVSMQTAVQGIAKFGNKETSFGLGNWKSASTLFSLQKEKNKTKAPESPFDFDGNTAEEEDGPFNHGIQFPGLGAVGGNQPRTTTEKNDSLALESMEIENRLDSVLYNDKGHMSVTFRNDVIGIDGFKPFNPSDRAGCKRRCMEMLAHSGCELSGERIDMTVNNDNGRAIAQSVHLQTIGGSLQNLKQTWLSLSATNYPCNENSLTYIANFSAYNGNIKEKPAVSKSQRKSLLFGGHCARYVQTQYGNYIFLKLPYAVRSAAPDKQQKGLKWQVCDGRGMLQSNSRAEGTND